MEKIEQKDASHLLIGNQIGLFNTITIHTIEDQAASITAWSQSYDQLSSGSFYGRMNEIWFENAQFFLETTSKSIHQSCNPWPGAIWFGITEPSTKTGFINDIPFNGGDVLSHTGGKSFELITPDDFNIIGIVIDKKTLKHYVSNYDPNYDFNTFLKVFHWKLKPQYKQYNWTQLIWALHELKQFHILPLEECELFQDQLISYLVNTLLLDFIPNNSQSSITLAKYRKIVSKTRDYIHYSTDQTYNINDICQYFNVSRRTLQNAFQHIVGMSPNHYLKTVRLNVFRQSLVNNHKEQTIQDIAAQHGFWHTSQLAADYRCLFGERPSETLKSS